MEKDDSWITIGLVILVLFCFMSILYQSSNRHLCEGKLSHYDKPEPTKEVLGERKKGGMRVVRNMFMKQCHTIQKINMSECLDMWVEIK